MKLKLYQVDAFAEKVFTGIPAAVCPLENWLPDEVLQNIAMENNLAETAFYILDGDHFHLRWFTPKVEVDLCGHATVATAHVLFNHEGHPGNSVSFQSRSGLLTVTRKKDLLTLDFPTDTLEEISLIPELTEGFNIEPTQAFKGKTDLLLVFKNEDDIIALNPDFRKVGQLKARGVIATAPGKEVDFVSRFFAPQCGIDEDPVTGSAHTTLTPFWSSQLNKKELNAIQLSSRKGFLRCVNAGDRTRISGKAKTYLVGEIII
ncbi:MAG: PhzF family phenazine biosynthesis protein [Cyclobacteriaceae bacterium]